MVLCCRARALSDYGERGLVPLVARELLPVEASRCRAWAPGTGPSALLVHGVVAPRPVKSSWATGRPHVSWQVDSYPLIHCTPRDVLTEWLHSQGSGVRQR